MTREDIVRMAREAGIYRPYWDDDEDPNKDPPRWVTVGPIPPLLERFAALVAAAERKRLAWTQEHWTEYEHNIAAAEREACAKVCDRLAMEHYKNDIAQILEKCADAIRARGEK